MNKITTFLIFLFIGLNISNAQFISNDGELHVIAGAVISAGTYTLVYTKTKNKKKAFWYSLGAATLVGVAKEVYDSTKKFNRFDPADALATSVGGVTASATLALFVGKKRKKNKNMALVN